MEGQAQEKITTEGKTPPAHNEARMWVSFKLTDPQGVEQTFTIREGADSEMFDGMAKIASYATKTLLGQNWTRNGNPPQATKTRAATSPPQHRQPAPQTGGNGATPAQAGAYGSDGYIDTEVIRVGMTRSRNPKVEFWITSRNRQYPEIDWSMGAEKLYSDVADWLAIKLQNMGHDPVELDEPSTTDYSIPCRVFWRNGNPRSNGNGFYKDIVGIEPL